MKKGLRQFQVGVRPTRILGTIDLMKKGLRLSGKSGFPTAGKLGTIDLMKKGLRRTFPVLVDQVDCLGTIDLMKKGLRPAIRFAFFTSHPSELLT